LSSAVWHRPLKLQNRDGDTQKKATTTPLGSRESSSTWCTADQSFRAISYMMLAPQDRRNDSDEWTNDL
jgi:hypothetical protein